MSRRGMSLIEVVLSATLLSLALMAILTLLPSANMVGRQAEIRMQADHLAQTLLERRRLLPFAQLVPQPPTLLAVVKRSDLPDMQPIVEIVATGAGNHAREIRVTVTWKAFHRDGSLTRASVVTSLLR